MLKMNTQTVPSADDLISQILKIEPLIRSESAAAEKERRLSTSVADALRELGCYRMFRPRERGGFEFDPVSGFRIVEALARIDSAAGWNVAIGNASEPFGAWFPDETTAEVFGPADATMAGAFNPPRKAVPVDGGYRLSGQTTFNSNCHAANWVLGLANIYDGDKPRLGENRVPETLITVFPKSDAEIVDNWDTLGMRGTGSHDIRVENIFVPESRAVPFVRLEKPSSAYSGPLHRMTVWPPVAINGVSALGIAQAAIDEYIDLAGIKTPAYTAKTLRSRPIVQLRVAHAEAKLAAARVFFHDTFNAAWQTAVGGSFLDMQQKADCQQAASYMVMASAEAVSLIHSIAGTAAIRNEQPFQRHFRDIHVITQHAFVCESRLEAVGQVRLGLEPEWGFFHI
jgi:alkylation response protein AidB-like acyl-CoA dehydrogenase